MNAPGISQEKKILNIGLKFITKDRKNQRKTQKKSKKDIQIGKLNPDEL